MLYSGTVVIAEGQLAIVINQAAPDAINPALATQHVSVEVVVSGEDHCFIFKAQYRKRRPMLISVTSANRQIDSIVGFGESLLSSRGLTYRSTAVRIG